MASDDSDVKVADGGEGDERDVSSQCTHKPTPAGISSDLSVTRTSAPAPRGTYWHQESVPAPGERPGTRRSDPPPRIPPLQQECVAIWYVKPVSAFTQMVAAMISAFKPGSQYPKNLR